MSRREPAKRPAFEPPERLLRPARHHPGMRRPAAITAGTVLTLLRVLSGGFVLAEILKNWRSLVGSSADLTDLLTSEPEVEQIVRGAIFGFGVVGLLVMLTLAVFIYHGRNWARVLTMALSAASVSMLFAAWWVQGQQIRISSTLPSLSLDILVLLALSSPSAAAYSHRFPDRLDTGDKLSA